MGNKGSSSDITRHLGDLSPSKILKEVAKQATPQSELGRLAKGKK